VCPCTDVLELVQPVLDQLARPAAAEPLSWGPSWKISAKPRTETVPELLEGKSAGIPLHSLSEIYGFLFETVTWPLSQALKQRPL
jgi:hypothetical protein